MDKRAKEEERSEFSDLMRKGSANWDINAHLDCHIFNPAIQVFNLPVRKKMKLVNAMDLY